MSSSQVGDVRHSAITLKGTPDWSKCIAELTAMADAAIDLDALAAANEDAL